MSRRQQNPWTPETKTGVNYFKHQTKHFLTPYGKTHGLLTSRETLDKMYHWNCEWLTRPNYAISELADTLYANLATLSDYKDKVFTKRAVDPLLEKARPIRTVLQRFNKKRLSNCRGARRERLGRPNKVCGRRYPCSAIKTFVCSVGSYVYHRNALDDLANTFQPS